jgi:alanine dehydrogenase
MPGAVPHTSTYALTNATLPHVVALARKGLGGALRDDPALGRGVNVYEGNITNAAVAEAHGLPFTPLDGLVPHGA